ncbi:MAG: 6-pyruvoyl-tetrahydropterin synthase-related protein [Candidatus Sulfotelmatobacter sp.]
MATKLPSLTKSDQAVTSALRCGGLTWAPLLSIAAAAFAVEVPFFFQGTPSGHDVEFHLYSWLEVLSQWKHGIIYPRWAALAHFAYGEPRFIFYPPASWTLGAALSAIFPWVAVSDIYIWLALVGAGVSMFLLAGQWLDRRDATYAAVLYAVNPYHLVIVYWRSAFAELLAASLLPMLLLLVLRTDEKGRRVAVLLALLLAFAWLINAPAAVMIHYSLALLVLVVAWQRRSPRALIVASAAVVLGGALAAFYLFPAIYEQRWINIAQAISPGARPLDNFLFIRTGDADHDAFNRLISWVALAEIILTITAGWTARRRSTPNRILWLSLVFWAAACILLMLSISNPLWTVLPKLRYMQFPWRWMLCLGVPFSLLTALGVRRWRSRVALYLVLLGVIGFAWQRFQPPWWDTTGDLREMQDNMFTGVGYEGTDEYTPAGDDLSDLDKEARRVKVDGPAHAAIHVFDWGAERKDFTAEMSGADNLVLRLLNYPAWRVEVNGRQVRPGAREGTGQMLVPVEAGTNRVQITFVRTWDRTAGDCVSVLALIFVVVSMRQSSRRYP